MIKNIVFDVGKVLIDWYPFETMEQLGFSKDVMDTIRKYIFDSGEWSREDEGLMTRDELKDYFASLMPKYGDNMRLFYDHATDSIRPRNYVKPLISTLKAMGYKVYVLSNFGESAMLTGVKMGGINFLDDLDGYLFSYEIHKVKPNPDIYEALYERYGLKPAECLFIDDLKENIAGARATGMDGIVFESIDQLKTELISYGIDIEL